MEPINSTPEPGEGVTALLREIREAQSVRERNDRRRNRLLAWLLAWSVAVPAMFAGGAFLLLAENAETASPAVSAEPAAGEPSATAPPVTTVPPTTAAPADTRPPAPSCDELGKWIADSVNRENDRPADEYRYSPSESFELSPEGLRDDERMCSITLEPYSWVRYANDIQITACSDRDGNMGRARNMDYCLAVIR